MKVSVDTNVLLRFVVGDDKTQERIAAEVLDAADMRNVVTDRAAIEAGLAVIDAGGDFADGVIAFEGRWLGGETFVSFDKKAVKLLNGQGVAARLLS